MGELKYRNYDSLQILIIIEIFVDLLIPLIIVVLLSYYILNNTV